MLMLELKHSPRPTKKMEEEPDPANSDRPPSFDGALARFALDPAPPALRRSSRTRTPSARAHAGSSLDAAEWRFAVKEEEDDKGRVFPPATAVSRKRKEAPTRSGSGTPSPKKHKHKARGYAPPETYAHLSGLSDHVAEDLDGAPLPRLPLRKSPRRLTRALLQCSSAASSACACHAIMRAGDAASADSNASLPHRPDPRSESPGHMSAVRGHHYANPTNHFWHCLHLSGFTPRLLPASEDHTLPAQYNLGLTNLVARPSAAEAELSAQDMADGVPVLLAKLARLRPRVLCFVGKGIWLHVERALRTTAGARGNGGGGARGPLASSSALARVFEAEAGASLVPAQEHAAIKVEEGPAADLGAGLPPSMSTSRPKAGRGRTSAAKAKAAAPPFAYGLQPYKALHDAVPGVRATSVRETLFCVFPSTSGRVVSHQVRVHCSSIHGRLGGALD
ncbi:hypothetical protein BC834DRAFT_82436 [Gloeopeniophorella convolvens]|nr:hypothetical protein BC834DRAFT_82436 [Gloeopeniophorella convolvens]